jgi:pyridoxal phosphate enzyme (YggS family)
MTLTPQTSDALRVRLKEVRSRVEDAARRSHREIESIKIVAVSKTHPAATVREAIAAGAADLGENRVQEAESKITEVGRQAARWHLIGHLQSNKARRAVQLFDVIHSLDSISLARKLDRACGDEQRENLSVMIQVDLGHEATKTGASEDEVDELVNVVRQCEHLRLIGLMTLPPFFEDAELARPYFVRLRELRDRFRAQRAFGESEGELSMGMTNDYPIAIEEGATILRIGTAIFGDRNQK